MTVWEAKKWHAKRERDPHTRAVSFVVSRGFGLHVQVTLWWFTLAYHRRDPEMERLLRIKVREMESARPQRPS